MFDHEAIVEGIQLIRPGESMTVDLQGQVVTRRKYWQLPSGPSPAWSRDVAIRKLRDTLGEVTAKHLVSDAPLGLFLSGGIDSQSLAALATGASNASLQSITIGFDDKRADESEDAENVAKSLGLRHRTVRIHGPEMLADLDLALASFDQPTVDGFNNFFVARAARHAGLTVALSGLGADELFGGYASFRDVPRAMRWQSLWPILTPFRFIAAATLDAINSRAALKTAQLIKRRRGWVQTYFLRRELFSAAERRELWKLPDESDEVTGLRIDVIQSLESAIAHENSGINRVARLELLGYMGNMLLRDADAATMASGLELRVPFLDHRLVEMVLPLPGEWKRPSAYPKPLLVDALAGRLDAVTVAKKKRGFAFPWRAWLDGPLNDRARNTLHDDQTWSLIGFQPAAVRRLWDRYAAGDRRVLPLQIVALLSLSHYVNGHRLR